MVGVGATAAGAGVSREDSLRLAVADVRLILDNVADLIDVERLGQNLIEILAVRPAAEQPFGVGGYGDQSGDAAPLRLAFDRCGDLQPIHLGQVEIQQRHVVVVVAQRLQCLQPVGGDVDLVAAMVQEQLQEIVRDRAVLGNEHPAGTGTARCGLDLLDGGGTHHSVALCGLAAPLQSFAGGRPAAATRVGADGAQ